MFYFYIRIIKHTEQEINKKAIPTQAIFKPHNKISSLSNNYVFPYCQRRKEGHVLFNDALNTFYLPIYGVIRMVKDHTDSERGKTLPPHRLFFPINSKGYFICTTPNRG